VEGLLQEKHRILKQIFCTRTTFQTFRQTDAKLNRPLEKRQQFCTLVASYVKSRQLICKHAARTIIEIRNEGNVSLQSAIHQHYIYAWPDPTS
jgi:hypothetical protein